MNEIFASRLKYSRQRLKISQKNAAIALLVSPALLSHYENGAREYGLEFLCRAADYYGVSVDFLLGRSVETRETETAEQTGEESRTLRQSITGTLGTKLVSDSVSVIFELSDKISPDMTKQTLDYFSSAIYRYWNLSFSGLFDIPVILSQKESPFITSFLMSQSEIKIMKASGKIKSAFPFDLKERFPAKAQSLLNILSRADKAASQLK